MQQGSNQGAADILVPVRNHYPATRELLEGIYRYTDYPFHLYIIDNASTDETVDIHKIYTRDITIVRNRQSRGWGGAINQGIQMGSNPYLVFMNHGIELAHGWLGNMISFLNTHPRIAAVGPLVSDRHDWQCVDRVREKIVPQIPQFFTEDIHERNRILQFHFQRTGILVDGVLGFFCAALTRRAILEVGLLVDTHDGGGDADYCRRLRKAGYVLGLSLDTYVIRHQAAGSRA
ncbi:MAG: glycosyltransferase [Acidobacteriia bacterium]|nr:glycosyltransferase [Terriglobia bacterium]